MKTLFLTLLLAASTLASPVLVTISGRVTDTKGQSVARATVTALSTNCIKPTSVLTDSTGFYSLTVENCSVLAVTATGKFYTSSYPNARLFIFLSALNDADFVLMR